MTHLYDRREITRLFLSSVVGTAAANIELSAADVSPDRAAVFIRPNEGERGKIGVNDITFKLDSSNTSGLLGSAEMLLQPGRMGAVPHFHTTFDEVVRVLEGTVTVLVGDTTYDVAAGAWHLRRRGVVHAFWNAGQVPARSIEIYIPGGHEAYMKEIATIFQATPQPERSVMDEIAARYDVHFVWDRLSAILEKHKIKL